MTNTTRDTKNNIATVQSSVIDYKELNYTINNIIEYVDGLHMNELDKLFTNSDDYIQVPHNRALLNLLNGVDFSEVGLYELNDFVQLIKIIGLDNYELYSIPEYTYMYNELVQAFDKY